MGFEAEELQERIRALSDDELLRMVEHEADQYRPEALAVAREEVAARKIGGQWEPNELQAGVAEEDVDPDEDPELSASQRGLLCPACGSGLRSALLFGESQIVAVFEATREQRFVRALVCPKCGTADLFVDFETDVED